MWEGRKLSKSYVRIEEEDAVVLPHALVPQKPELEPCGAPVSILRMIKIGHELVKWQLLDTHAAQV